jgi:hypothetical protein
MSPYLGASTLGASESAPRKNKVALGAREALGAGIRGPKIRWGGRREETAWLPPGPWTAQVDGGTPIVALIFREREAIES